MDKKGNRKEEQEVFSFNLQIVENQLKKELEKVIVRARTVTVDVVDITGRKRNEIEILLHEKWDAKFLAIRTAFTHKMIDTRERMLQSTKRKPEIEAIMQVFEFSYEITQFVKEIVSTYNLEFIQEAYVKKELMELQGELKETMNPLVIKVFDSITAYVEEEQREENHPINVLAKMTLLLAYHKLKSLLQLGCEQLHTSILMYQKEFLSQCKTNLSDREYKQVEKSIQDNYVTLFIDLYTRTKIDTLKKFYAITNTIYIKKLKEFEKLEKLYLEIQPKEVKLDTDKFVNRMLSSTIFTTRKKEVDTKDLLSTYLEKGIQDVVIQESKIPSYVSEAIEKAIVETKHILKEKKEEEITISYLKEIVKKELFQFKEMPIELYRL